MPGAARKVAGMTSVDSIACLGPSRCLGLGTGTSPEGVIEQLAPMITTSTSVHASALKVEPHRSVAFTATVAPRPAGSSVTFTSNGNTIGGCGNLAVRAGVARCVVSFARPGTIVVRAAYAGDADEIGSTSKPVTENVAT